MRVVPHYAGEILRGVEKRRLFLPVHELLFLACKFLDALLRRWQIFWHRASRFRYGFAHDASNLMMRLIGAVFVFHLLGFELLPGKTGAERIGDQFIAAHIVKDVLRVGCQPFAFVDVVFAQAAIQTKLRRIRITFFAYYISSLATLR